MSAGASRVWVYAFDVARGSLAGAANSERHLLLPEVGREKGEGERRGEERRGEKRREEERRGEKRREEERRGEKETRPRHVRKASGPRHLDFHPAKPWVYVLCELDGEMSRDEPR